jgi:purine-binding chemotaxis protein CheW
VTSPMTRSRYRHDPSKNLVGFSLGDVKYAVPIAHVKEIANPMLVVVLPHAPPAVMGVSDYRGEVVPVVDLRSRFGLPSVEATRKTKWIVVDVAGRLAALVVDSVTEVFGTGGTDLRPPPSIAGDDRRGIAGVTNHEGALVFVLDTARMKDVTDPLAAGGRISQRPPPRSLPKGAPT